VERILDGPKEQPFDVVLMDIQMPDIDGIEATRRLRQGGYEGPIVALTAHAMASHRQLCLEAGCNEHLSKPVDRRQLLSTLERLLGPADEPVT
jgi:CheY-like chemotaxis protein